MKVNTKVVNLLNLFSASDTTTIKDIEFLGVGKWYASSGIVDVTAQDLVSVQQNILSGKFAPVGLSFGHNTDPSFTKAMADSFGLTSILPLTGDNTGQGAAALGQIANPRIIQNGLKLIGDIVNVPNKLAQFMGKGFGYNTVSPTLVPAWPDLNGKVIQGPVMIALGLLGAQYPAFGVQKGLEAAQKMASTLKTQFQNLEGMPEEVFVLTGFEYKGDDQMVTQGCPVCSGHQHSPPVGATPAIHLHGMNDYNPTGFGQLKEGQGGQKYPMNLEFQGIKDTLDQMSGLLKQNLELQQANFAASAAQSFHQSLTASSANWTHLPDEERARTVGVITELNGTSPEAARVLIEQHNTLAAMAGVANQQQNAGQNKNPDPNEFFRASLSAAGGQPVQQYDMNNPGEVLNQTVNEIVQRTGMRYNQAYSQLQESPTGGNLIAAAQKMNALQNAGLGFLLETGQQAGQQDGPSQQGQNIGAGNATGPRHSPMQKLSGDANQFTNFINTDPRRQRMTVVKEVES